MTAQLKKTEQKRLDSCVLLPLKWLKTREKARQHDHEALTIGDFATDTAVRVEITRQNRQSNHNATLLGKYPVEYPPIVGA